MYNGFITLYQNKGFTETSIVEFRPYQSNTLTRRFKKASDDKKLHEEKQSYLKPENTGVMQGST
jgi:hypothetical protein